MDISLIKEILQNTDCPHPGGSEEERACADYLLGLCRSYCENAHIEPFSLPVSRPVSAELLVDGRRVECTPFFLSEDADVSGDLYFLHEYDRLSLKGCCGRIVVADGYPFHFQYKDIVDAGALALICYSGNAFAADSAIEQRSYVTEPSHGVRKIPAVTIHARDALYMFTHQSEKAVLRTRFERADALSGNIVMDFPGENGSFILCTAHYDSISGSHGSYDNMSGCLALLDLAGKLSNTPDRPYYGVRIVLTGCEELGGVGVKNYTALHAGELKQCALNVNVDMLGAMGAFNAVCTAGPEAAAYVRQWGESRGIPMKVTEDVYSGDSDYLADAGIPAVSFTRFSPYMKNVAPFHDPADDSSILSLPVLAADMDAVASFTAELASLGELPFPGIITEEMREKLDISLGRRREDS